jgi:hypothetical protein
MQKGAGARDDATRLRAFITARETRNSGKIIYKIETEEYDRLRSCPIALNRFFRETESS